MNSYKKVYKLMMRNDIRQIVVNNVNLFINTFIIYYY